MAFTKEDFKQMEQAMFITFLKKKSKVERFLMRAEVRREKGIEAAELLDRLLERIEENENN